VGSPTALADYPHLRPIEAGSRGRCHPIAVLSDGFVALYAKVHSRAGTLLCAGSSRSQASRRWKLPLGSRRAWSRMPVTGKTLRGLEQSFETTMPASMSSGGTSRRLLLAQRGASRLYWRGNEKIGLETTVVTNGVPARRDQASSHFRGHAAQGMGTGESTWDGEGASLWEGRPASPLRVADN
jgi:hypothetical protein